MLIITVWKIQINSLNSDDDNMNNKCIDYSNGDIMISTIMMMIMIKNAGNDYDDKNKWNAKWTVILSKGNW